MWCRRARGSAVRRAEAALLSAPTERFSSRAENYARYRPGYPPSAIDLLAARCGLGAQTVVADVGSGTGLLTEPLLERGAQVFAIEPNDAMRAAAEAHLAGQPRFHSVKATAEATTLPPQSIDLWVAGQAFHWFEALAARREALRVLRSGGWGALLWNEHPPQQSSFLHDYDRLLRRHAAEYAAVLASRLDEERMREFFGGAMERITFPNQQSFDLTGLEGRLLSSSYAPQPGQPQYAPMMQELRTLFDRHQRNGQIVFPYVTLVYLRQLSPLGA
jgi:SAM-dependent methyltransferase